jgi:phosphoglycolate phosphatase-like HAD superfamily hydrolase
MIICLFDIDGTLISTGGAGQAAMARAIASFGLAPETDDIAFSGRTDREIVRDLFLHHDIADTADNVTRFCDEYIRQLAFTLRARPGSVLPGVRDLIDLLAPRSELVVGLLTGNLRRGAEGKLRHYELMDYFAFGAYGDHHLDRNHVAHEALAAAREHTQTSVSPDQVWIIGDTPRDVLCARAIGANVIAVATGAYSAAELGQSQPDILLENMESEGDVAAIWG